MTEIWLHDTFFNLAAGMLRSIVARLPECIFFSFKSFAVHSRKPLLVQAQTPIYSLRGLGLIVYSDCFSRLSF